LNYTMCYNLLSVELGHKSLLKKRQEINRKNNWIRPYWIRPYWIWPYWIWPHWIRPHWIRPHWIRPYWIRSYWIRPYWIRPYWIRPYWIRPYWIRPYWIRPCASVEMRDGAVLSLPLDVTHKPTCTAATQVW